MTPSIGPWSTIPSAGSPARPGTFWRQPMARLAQTDRGHPRLSRREALRLGAAGVLSCGLPSVRLIAGPPASAQGEAPPKLSGRIYAWARMRTGEEEKDKFAAILSIDPTTGAWTKLLEGEDYFYVRASPDGRTLAYSFEKATWTCDARDGSNRRRVTDLGSRAIWSPEGDRIIVRTLLNPEGVDERSERGRFAHWVVGLDGSNPKKLPIPETDYVQDWSPDGGWLSTLSDRPGPEPGDPHLCVVRPDGTGRRRLTGPAGEFYFPYFSPDGRKLVYARILDTVTSLWTVDVDGSLRRKIYESALSALNPCWSPDGEWLAVMMWDWVRNAQGIPLLNFNPELGNFRIEVMDEDGRRRQRLDLPIARWIGEPDWR